MHKPLHDLQRNQQRARDANDSNAELCCLATVSKAGRPGLRVLVLREVTNNALAVFFSRSSAKWEQLQATKTYEILIYWTAIKRQYRIRGSFTEIPQPEIQKNWKKRAYGSKLLDHYYQRFDPQSSPITSRDQLLEGIATLAREYPESNQVPFPQGVMGVRFAAEQVEVWRESPDRIHDRSLYSLRGPKWHHQVLVP